MTQKSEAQKGNITPEMEFVAEYENIDVNKLARLIDKGLVVIPKNINGHSKPCGIGEGLKTKVNANIGSSSKIDDIDLEIDKARLAQEYGADALMDLSTGSDLKLFRKKINNLELLKAKYDHTEVNVNKIVEGLEQHQIQLLKDIAMLDKLYDQNLVYFKELSMYIAAGKKRLEAFRANEVQQARDKAAASGLPEDAQFAKDLADKGDRFEKKLYDLELTRNISIQMAPQIRLIQSSNQIMAEKIQPSLVNTIPLWKSQMVLALGLAHTENAMKAQRAVTDLTNDLLTKNAEKLHMATVETAKEAERAEAHQQAAHRHHGRGAGDPAAGQGEAPRRRAGAGQHRGRAPREDHGDALSLRSCEPSSRRGCGPSGTVKGRPRGHPLYSMKFLCKRRGSAAPEGSV